MPNKLIEKRRETNRKFGAKRYAKRRVWVDEIKLRQGCIDCGYRKHPAALQFDHIDPTTKGFVICSSLSRCWKSILGEIEKCVIRCANCHAEKTANNKESGRGRPRIS